MSKRDCKTCIHYGSLMDVVDLCENCTTGEHWSPSPRKPRMPSPYDLNAIGDYRARKGWR